MILIEWADARQEHALRRLQGRATSIPRIRIDMIRAECGRGWLRRGHGQHTKHRPEIWWRMRALPDPTPVQDAYMDAVAVTAACLASMRPRERAVMVARFLRGDACMDIAARLGVTPGRVSQIIAEAADRARRLWRAA